MAHYYVGSDHCYSDSQHHVDVVAEALEKANHQVDKCGVGPNQEKVVREHAGESDAIVVFICCGIDGCTEWSIKEAIRSGNGCKCVFAYTGFAVTDSSKPLYSAESCDNYKIGASWDAGQYLTASSKASCEQDIAGRTHKEYFQANSEYIAYCYSKESIEDLAQKVANGDYFGGIGDGNTITTGTAQVKDATFEDCIRRICAATDSVFMVENNAAILFPYTDWMAITLRQQITKIPAKQIDPDVFSIEYNTEGFYNKVTTVFGADESVEQTTDDKEQEEQTTTQGNTTSTRKSMPTGGTQISEQYDPLVKIYGTLEKKVTTNFPDEETAQYVANALLIQYIREFNNSCRVRTLNQNKFIGGTFYNVENPFTKQSDLFYLNSYTIFKEKDQPFTYDLEFKYGPEGAEDLLDYQKLSGGGGQVGSPVASGTEEGIWADAQKIHYANGDTCSAQDPKEAYETLQPKIGQPDCKADCYGMSAYLHYRFNEQANIPCRVVGNSQHHVVMLFKNNAWQETRDEMRRLEHNFHWRTNQVTTTLLEATASTTGAGSTPNSSGTTATEGQNAKPATGGN